ncbi:MAG: ABC transporter ATP-binding protein [Bacteroidota bacterium]
MLLRAHGLKKSYGELQVLRGVDLEVQEGEIVAIVGASGAGKSTLLHLIGTLDIPDEGQVFLKDDEITSLRGRQLAAFRNRHIGFIFQFHQLLPEFSALENVAMPALITGVAQREAMESGSQLLGMMGLSARSSHKPSALSGGEQQRVAIARALINKPSLILADEPSGNLDSVNAKALHELFFDLRKTMNQTFVIVTHNPELASMADRTLTMHDGRIV